MKKFLLFFIFSYTFFYSNAQTATITPSNAFGVITICDGTTIEMGVLVLGDTPTGYQWQTLDSNGDWADISGAINETYTASLANNYRVKVFFSGGGSILSDGGDGVELRFVTGTVSITNNTSECLPQSGNISLNGSASYTGLDGPPTENFNWKLNNILQNVDNTTLLATTTGSYKFVYIVSSSDIESGSCTFESNAFALNSCCEPPSNPTNTRINFDACTTVSSYPINACEGTSLYLISSCPSGSTTQWYINSTTTTPITTGTSFAGCLGSNEYANDTPALGLTEYYASCLSSSCESNRVLVGSVFISPNPKPPTVGEVASEICSGNCINITASCEEGSTLRWTEVNGFESTSNIIMPVCQTVTSTSNIEYIAVCRMVSSPNCFSNSVSKTILVNAIPDAPTVTNPTICSGTATTLSATCTSGIVRWYGTATATTALTANPNETFTTPVLTGNISYFASCEIGSTVNCVSNRTEVQITVQTVSIPTATSSYTVCSGNTITLTATCPSGDIVKWYNSTGTPIQNGSNFTTSPITANAIYYVACGSTSPACEGERVQINVAVNSNPTSPISPTASPATICEGETSTLRASGCTATNEQLVWYESATSGSSVGVGNNLNVSPTSSTNYYVECTNTVTNCTSNRVFTNIEVNTRPLSLNGITGDNITCSGNSISLSAIGCGSGSVINWYANTTTSTALATGNTFNTGSLSSNQTYYASCKNSTTGCESTRISKSVYVYDTPPSPIASGSTICSGSTTTLTASCTDGNVKWYDAISAGNFLSNDNYLTPSLTTNTSYYVECERNYESILCSSARTKVDVTVNNLPLITATSTSNVCVGNTISFTATGGVSYLWSGPNSFSASGATASRNNALLSDSGIYTVTVTNANGCSATATTAVVVNSLPIPSIASNSPICELNTISLSASGGQNYLWSGPNSFTASGATASRNNALVSYSGIYTVTVINANGCSGTATTAAVVNSLPIPSIASNSPICELNTISLSASGGQNYLWSGPNSFTASGATASRNNALLSNSGIYTVTITNANGCSATATTAVVVNSLPIPSIASNSPVCELNTISLSATGGQNYLWSGPNSFTASGATASRNNALLNYSGIYTVTITNANGCSATATTAVVVNSLPIPSIASNSPICLCPSEAISLSASGCSGSISWSNGATGTSITVSTIGIYTASCQATCLSNPSNIISISLGTAPNAPTVTTNLTLICGSEAAILQALGCNGNILWSNGQTSNTISVTTSGTYSATCSNNCGISAKSNEITILKSTTPTPPTIAISSPILCGETQKTLTATGCSNGQIRWNNNSTGNTITISSSGTYGAVCENICGISTASNILNIQFRNIPTATASNSGPYEIGQTIQLSSAGGSSYIWTGRDDYLATNQNPSILNAQLTDAGIYTVTVTNSNGCSATATTNVVVNTCSEVFKYNYVRAGNTFEWFFPLTNGITIAELPINTGIIGTPICQLDTVSTTSVKFIMTGPEPLYNQTVIENIYPYSPFENRWFQIFGPIFPPGTYTLTSYGYSQENATGNVMFGPQTITFTVVGGSYNITMTNTNLSAICAGNSVNVSFEASGSFIQDNSFQIQLSDANGSFENPVIIGQSMSAGSVLCQIPANTPAGTGYKIRVYATKPAILSSNQSTTFSIKPRSLSLQSPTDDYSTTQIKQASEKITATNIIQSQAKVTYDAGRFIILNSGFEAKAGSTFKAEIVGCN